jgi:hypothetical protein
MLLRKAYIVNAVDEVHHVTVNQVISTSERSERQKYFDGLTAGAEMKTDSAASPSKDSAPGPGLPRIEEREVTGGSRHITRIRARGFARVRG